MRDEMSEPRDGPVGATGQGQDKAPAVLSFVRFQQAAPRSPTPDAVWHWPCYCYPVHVKGLVRATVGPSREKVLPSPVRLHSLNCGTCDLTQWLRPPTC